MKRIPLLFMLLSQMALAQKSKTQLKAVDDLVERHDETERGTLLLKIQKESTNKEILYAIEAALQAIKS